MSALEAGDALREQGFAVVRGLLSPEEVERCVRKLEDLSGRTRESFRPTAGRMLPGGLSGAWTLPDGVSRTPELWPLITNPRLLAAIRERLGPEIRYLQHSDLHVGFSAITWHRDCVNRRYGPGGDWDETSSPYRLVRVGIYLQSYRESRFALRVVPGSHRAVPPDARLRRQIERRQHVVSQALGVLTHRDPLADHSTAIATDPGDAILFDPRLLHAGSPISGPKYSVFLAYGVPNAHFARHAAYYRHLRRELRYADLHPELVRRLREAGLYAEAGGAERPAAAYEPSLVQRWLGRYLRPS
jgi:Phytanoyl-CoA dioxygenase (PhyH)